MQRYHLLILICIGMNRHTLISTFKLEVKKCGFFCFRVRAKWCGKKKVKKTKRNTPPQKKKNINNKKNWRQNCEIVKLERSLPEHTNIKNQSAATDTTIKQTASIHCTITSE